MGLLCPYKKWILPSCQMEYGREEEFASCIEGMCAMWRIKVIVKQKPGIDGEYTRREVGYCGLAGEPSE